MRRRIAVIIGTCLVAQLALASTPASAGSRIRAREVVGGLNQPVAFTFGPGKKIWYVEKSTGQVRIHDLDTDADRLFVTVPGVNGDGERGMLGIALHPNYPDKPLVYIYATRSADGGLRNQVLRYRDNHGSGVHRKVLLSTVAGGSPYHNGGRIAFGPDGMLYAIVGDAPIPQRTGPQQRARGNILRIEPDGGVPNDNPFGNRYAYTRATATPSASRSTHRPTSSGRPRTVPSATTRSTSSCRAATTAGDRARTVRGIRRATRTRTARAPSFRFAGSRPPSRRPASRSAAHADSATSSRGRRCSAAVNGAKIRRIQLNGKRTDVRSVKVVFRNGGNSVLSMESAPKGTIYFSDFDGINKLVRV